MKPWKSIACEECERRGPSSDGKRPGTAADTACMHAGTHAWEVALVQKRSHPRREHRVYEKVGVAKRQRGRDGWGEGTRQGGRERGKDREKGSRAMAAATYRSVANPKLSTT
eukprot:2448082-Pleurochrysis_carterae.AAC.3